MNMKKLVLTLLLFVYFPVVFSQQRNYDVEYSYIEALRNRESGNLTAAVYILNSILRVDSTCAACYYQLSDIYRSAGSIEQALNYAVRAYKLDSTSYWYVRNYAMLTLELGDTLNSLPLFDKLVRFSDVSYDDLLLFSNLALSYTKYRSHGRRVCDYLLSRYAEPELFRLRFKYMKSDRQPFKILLAYLDTCTITFPGNTDFILERALLLAENGKLRASRVLFNVVFRTDSFSFEAINDYARFFNSRRDRNFVFAYLDSFFSSAVEVSEKINWINLMLRADNTVFNAYLENKFLTIIQLVPLNSQLYESAFNYFLQRNRMDILTSLGKQYVKLYPEDISGWGRYILPLFVLGKYDVLDSIFKERPVAFRSPFGLYVAGFLYYNRKEYEKSRDYFIQSVEVEGQFPYKTLAINLLTDYYIKNGKRDSAFYYFEKALREDLADEIIMNNYAYYLSLAGKSLNKAEMLSRTAVMRYPKNSAFLDTYAWVLYRLQRYDEAYRYMRLALKYADDDRRELLEHYAAILYCSGRTAKGLKLMRKLFPDPKQYGSFFMSTVECGGR